MHILIAHLPTSGLQYIIRAQRKKMPNRDKSYVQPRTLFLFPKMQTHPLLEFCTATVVQLQIYLPHMRDCTSCMKTYKTRSKYHTQLAKSLDQILDLTAGSFFQSRNIWQTDVIAFCTTPRTPSLVERYNNSAISPLIFQVVCLPGTRIWQAYTSITYQRHYITRVSLGGQSIWIPQDSIAGQSFASLCVCVCVWSTRLVCCVCLRVGVFVCMRVCAHTRVCASLCVFVPACLLLRSSCLWLSAGRLSA